MFQLSLLISGVIYFVTTGLTLYAALNASFGLFVWWLIFVYFTSVFMIYFSIKGKQLKSEKNLGKGLLYHTLRFGSMIGVSSIFVWVLPFQLHLYMSQAILLGVLFIAALSPTIKEVSKEDIEK